MNPKKLSPSQNSLIEKIQNQCPKRVWSSGVQLLRSQRVQQDTFTEEEITFRVSTPGQLVSAKVSLWPNELDWYCDCKEKGEICIHTAAAVIFLKSRGPEPLESRDTLSNFSKISYRFSRNKQSLSFDRWAIHGNKELRLTDSLVSFMGGIQSGRIRFPTPAVTKEDYAIDPQLNRIKSGILDQNSMHRLLPVLSQTNNFQLDGQSIKIASKSLKIRAQLFQRAGTYWLKRLKDPIECETFKNGAALIGDQLYSYSHVIFNDSEKHFFREEERSISLEEETLFFSEVLPSLQRKIGVQILVENPPDLKAYPPRIELKLEHLGSEALSVFPVIVYGSPPIAEVQAQGLKRLSPQSIPIRNKKAEFQIKKKLQIELHLQPGQLTKFFGQDAIHFRERAKFWDMSGPGVARFAVLGCVRPRIEVNANDFDLFFEVEVNSSLTQTTPKVKLAEVERVFRAWKDQDNHVPLLGGGWAELPKTWLNQYGERLAALLSAKNKSNKVPNYLLPQLGEICEELGQSYPKTLENFRNFLEHFEKIPHHPVPTHLQAILRPYQQKGVNWLAFLKNQNMGALLADDMGLGKTLQALCVLTKHTLIVAPTSVLQSWIQQIEEYFPKSKFLLYHGPDRNLKNKEEITLTTYTTFRIDQELLTKIHWNCIIIDEAQMIKNPDSQITRAIHQLSGDFKLALSGTPIENRLEDLWSQFEFLNPGLLGERESFQSQFARPILKGDSKAIHRLRNRIRPFILRRLKGEVAPELPPRTEVVLHCQLAPEEEEVYRALLASTKEEIMQKLEGGGSILAVLELLLRLRQACCHCDLIPGQKQVEKKRHQNGAAENPAQQKARSSSKLDLLFETLDNSLAGSHKALIFSQWTSLLDLIEAPLREKKIEFVRLDGKTKDRKKVVDTFQQPSGPPVFLISLKAGGVGLNLTEADHIFLMDPWWNPAVEAQAADRAHRIGQKRPVIIHRLVAKGTVEDHILLLQKKKMQLSKSLLSETHQPFSLTKKDLLELLQEI